MRVAGKGNLLVSIFMFVCTFCSKFSDYEFKDEIGHDGQCEVMFLYRKCLKHNKFFLQELGEHSL